MKSRPYTTRSRRPRLRRRPSASTRSLTLPIGAPDTARGPHAAAIGAAPAARTIGAMSTTAQRRVLLAAPRGYCAGVDRAVIAVEKALEQYGAPIYVRK